MYHETTLLIGMLIKIKSYFIAVVVGFVSSTIRYIQYRRNIRDGIDEPNAIALLDWFLFGCMASVITMTGVAFLEYMKIEFSAPMILFIFWLGYITDYLFQSIPMMLKKTIEKYFK